MRHPHAQSELSNAEYRQRSGETTFWHIFTPTKSSKKNENNNRVEKLTTSQFTNGTDRKPHLSILHSVKGQMSFS